jgi:uncharacterized protein (DUF885 family)
MKYSLVSSAIVLALSLTGCSNEKQAVEVNTLVKTRQLNNEKTVNLLNQDYEEATKILFKQRAMSATMYGLSEEEAGLYYSDKLENYSPNNEAALRKNLQQLSTSIAGVNLKNASTLDYNNQQVMTGITQYFAGHADFSIGFIDSWMGLSPFIVNQINGPLIDIPRIMQNDQAITT